MPILNFSEALVRCADGNPKILLGNGFSQACLPEIFAYSSLFERADFSQLSENAREAFDVLLTNDFEIVMDALKRASSLVSLYGGPESQLVETFVGDASGLRDVLVSAVADSHPPMPGEIPDEAYWSCRRFLANFSRTYSLNYDLLLYWATMHEDNPFGDPVELHADDGFRTPDDGEAEYVTWEIENTQRQNVFYLLICVQNCTTNPRYLHPKLPHV